MTLRLVVHQTAPVLGEVGENRSLAADRLAREEPGSLVAFPELSLTGYDLGTRARELALLEDEPPPLAAPEGTTVVMGFPERTGDGRVYNAAGAFRDGAWLLRHRKRYLPTYGMFDEGRIFAPGARGPRLFHPHPEWPTAILVCEELWHPALAYLAALRGARLLLVLAAAPGRGEPEDPEEDGPRFRSHRAWRLLARTTALTHGIYLALVNRVGAEGSVVFAGGSLVVAPDGEVVAEASHEAEDRLQLRLDPERMRAARTPYAHLRDEDLALVQRELGEILAGDGG